MKNKTFRLLGLSTVFATALTIGFTSCKKDKDDNGSSAALSATIGTNAFKPKVVGASSHNGYISIVGGQQIPGDSLYVDLAIPDTAKVNQTIDFSGDAGLEIVTFSTIRLYSESIAPSHGSVTITSYDKTNKKIAGKFSGVIYNYYDNKDSVVVKDGTFNTTFIPY